MQNEKIINLDALTPDQLQAEDLLSQAALFIQTENYDAALETLKKAEELNPQEIDIYLRQAQIYIIREELEAAEKVLNRAVYIDKRDARVYYHKGNIAFMRSIYDEAIENYSQAETYGLKMASMCHSLGYSYEQIGKPDQAIQAYGRAIRLDPEHPLYRLRRINLLLQFDEVDEAESLVVDFIKQFPQIREGYCFAVDIHFRHERYDEAEKLLHEVLGDDPTDPVLMMLQVRTYTLQDRVAEATALAEKILKMENLEDETKKDALECLTRLYVMQDNVEKSLELLKQTIAEEKDGQYDVQARTMLLMMLSTMKRYQELLDASEEVLKVPALADQLYMVYMFKPMCLENLQRPQEAAEAYREAIIHLRKLTIRNPLQVDAHIFRAVCHKGLKQYDEALEQMKIVENLKVESAEFYALRASIYEAKGDKDKAAADMKKAREARGD